MVAGWQRSARAALSHALVMGAGLALFGLATMFAVHAVSQTAYVGLVSGLWTVFAAVVIGRFAPSVRIAVAGAAGLQAGIMVVFGLVALLGRMVLQFLLVFVSQGLVVVCVAAAAAGSRAVLRSAPAWAGLAVGLLGGIVVLLWELGHTGRGVLVAGTVLVAVSAAVLIRRAWHALVLVPLAAGVAAAAAPVYLVVPSALHLLFPVLAG
ncbi:hypothetical protein [Lentzea kentuckyensis]|uniref:hypothetical protein n=1 Tax=Lentzea kentuckyensis TaxID=360086 RepID=UPI00117A1D0A|nr:hypothetical protein [Lentzea kentuckyensis]